MTKSQSPLLGFNNNVRHRGRLFHIQTEDSGVRHPHVITHLFMDGGRILKSIKTSYADQVGGERLAEVVRELMKEQHKTMFIALRDGHFDHVIDSSDAAKSGAPPSAVPPSAAPVAADRMLAADAPLLDVTFASDRAPAAVAAAISDRLPDPGADTAVSLPPSPRIPLGLTEARSGTRTAARREAPDLFATQPSDAVHVTASEIGTPASSAKNPESGERPSSGRYAASRPAAMFSTGRAPEEGGSLFGDDIINEKSLDEVILSYLSDDLEAKGDKKK